MIQRGNFMNEKIEALPICEDVVEDLEKWLCEEEVKPHLIAWKKYNEFGRCIKNKKRII